MNETTAGAEGHQPILPYMEHFANTGDFVVCLGILATPATKTKLGMKHDGPVFTRNSSGHYLNAHHLDNLGAYVSITSAETRPRLFSYLGGELQPVDTPPIGKLEGFAETVAAVPAAIPMVFIGWMTLTTKLARDFCNL